MIKKMHSVAAFKKPNDGDTRWSSDRAKLVKKSIPERDIKKKHGCSKHIPCSSCIKYVPCCGHNEGFDTQQSGECSQ
jgi:hypothetical protein